MEKIKGIIMRVKKLLNSKKVEPQESHSDDSVEAQRISKYILKHFGRAITRLSDR